MAFTKELVTASQPQTVIFSVGRKRFKNPRPEVVRAVRENCPKIKIACTQLSENCSKVLPRDNPEHLHPYYARGRRFKECCGGTYVINFDEKITESPVYDLHQDFISRAALTALCK